MAANLDDVAKGAGVAKGTLYRYFENKAELYVAVLASNGEQFERKLRDAGRDESLAAPDRIPAPAARQKQDDQQRGYLRA